MCSAFEKAAVMVAMLPACSGIIDEGATASGGPVMTRPGTRDAQNGQSGAIGAPVATIPQPPPAGQTGPLPMPLRRLTRIEYNNTVRDLLGDTSRPADVFPPDPDGESGFLMGGSVSNVDAERLGDAAEAVARRAAAKLEVLLPCATTSADSCAQQFVTSFGKRAYRRPLDTAEVDDLMGLYRRFRTELGRDFRDSVRLLMQTMLQSPRFLYHWQVGTTAAIRDASYLRLNDYEAASRLSYFIWQSMPDEELFRAADGKRLSRPEDILAQAKRLLADRTRARGALYAFVTGWLELQELESLEKDTQLFPAFSPALRAAMIDELAAFMGHNVLEADGAPNLTALLTSTASWIDERMAKQYGVAGVTGAGERKVMVGEKRAGLLTMPAVLATHAEISRTSPVRRGKMLRERVIGCTRIPDPPPGVDTTPPAPTMGVSVRQQAIGRVQSDACKGCHALMDPLGFAVDTFGAIGQQRAVDDGGNRPDTAGILIGLASGDRPFADAIDLAKTLAAATEVQRCFATQMFRFALNRKEAEGDNSMLDAVATRFVGSGQDVKELLLDLVQTFAFNHRTPSAGEVLP
jgi:hypothetical protein